MRKDNTRQAKKQSSNSPEAKNKKIGGSNLVKKILLSVEGATEKAYFEGLKKNHWVENQLVSVIVIEAKKIEDIKEDYDEIWVVMDNDKRNAFILSEQRKKLIAMNALLPQTIKDDLAKAYKGSNKESEYFLSLYDYMRWLKKAIGAENVVDYWDLIQGLSEKKNELERLPKQYFEKSNKTRIAYSCIAFEFWLVLHFEYNKTPFLWVDKGKSETEDVLTYLQKWIPSYSKGVQKEKQKITAYSGLYEAPTKTFQNTNDEWLVLSRIFTACRNAKLLRKEMEPFLVRHKWYEINPYIVGIDDLLANLLNIKLLGEKINCIELMIQFDFHFDAATQNGQLGMIVHETDAFFYITSHHKQNFIIRDERCNEYKPTLHGELEFPNDAKQVVLNYPNLPASSSLTLIFKDPRERNKSSPLFVLLDT
jgi:hypothetical protein